MEDSGSAIGGIIMFIIYIAVIAISIASMWKIFEKAGRPGWAAIVPIYNIVVMLEIIGKPVWWIVLFFIPLANIYVAVMIPILMARSFNQSTGFGIGLLLLPVVFYPMLGFGDARYAGPAGLEKA
jgi:uncharacterized membrane protein YhaH (DUF805 family)